MGPKGFVTAAMQSLHRAGLPTALHARSIPASWAGLRKSNSHAACCLSAWHLSEARQSSKANTMAMLLQQHMHLHRPWPHSGAAAPAFAWQVLPHQATPAVNTTQPPATHASPCSQSPWKVLLVCLPLHSDSTALDATRVLHKPQAHC